ncbi:MAG: hypothetical protein WKF58_16510 [Ilumatobacteraceae bacterium]
MLLRAFSSGAVALAGVEAVSDGVPTFRKPGVEERGDDHRHDGRDPRTCFIGISVLASHLKPFRGDNDPTGIALMAEHVYDGKTLLFWITQIATFLILVLAANTAYADFPRAVVDHREGRLPAAPAGQPRRPTRVLQRRHRPRLGGGHPHCRLQGQHLGAHPALRVRRVHRVHAQPGRHGRASPQVREGQVAVGDDRSTPSAASPPASSPSWWSSRSSPKGRSIPAFLIPLMVVGFRSIRRHYDRVRRRRQGGARCQGAAPHAHRGRARRHDQQAVFSTPCSTPASWRQSDSSPSPSSPTTTSRTPLAQAWADFDVPIPLHTISSPYRDLTRPVLDYLDELDARQPRRRASP